MTDDPPEQGILPYFEAFYIEAMKWHVDAAYRSIVAVAAWLEEVHADPEQLYSVDRSELFANLTTIVHQAGCLSRYFFPGGRFPSSINIARAKTLRQRFAVDEDSPLADRNLRNAIEHFDERLDSYLADHPIGHFIPEDVDMVEPWSQVPTHVFRGFYTHPLTFSLLGNSYSIAPLVDELTRLYGLLLSASESGTLPSGR